MGFNIDQFIATGPVYGLARPALFDITLSATPPGVSSSGAAQQLSVLARSASLPAMNINPVQVPYFGRHYPIPGDRDFGTWSITVMNDEDFQLRNMFESWNNNMNSLISNRANVNTPTTNMVDLQVNQYGKNGPGDSTGIIRGYNIVNAWPANIGAIGLDWDATNTMETFDVTFYFSYFTPFSGYSPTQAPDSTVSTSANTAALAATFISNAVQ